MTENTARRDDLARSKGEWRWLPVRRSDWAAAVALRLAEESADLVIHHRGSATEAQEVVAEIREDGAARRGAFSRFAKGQ